METTDVTHTGLSPRPQTLTALVAGMAVAVGCAGPLVTPSFERAPQGMPLQQAWVVSLPQRFQQTLWRGWMLMPDVLVSQVAMDRGRLLSVEGQHVDEGFARRLRLIERDPSTGRVVRELPLGSNVPEGHETCRLLEIAGEWYIAHEPWTDAPTPRGILKPWPGPIDARVGPDVVRAGLLPPEMARRLGDGRCFNTDGRRLLVAAVLPRRAANDTRRWLAAACIDVSQPRLLWSGRAEIRFPIERYRGGVRVGRFGPVVLARASTIAPHGRRRCREFFAAFAPDTCRLLWSRQPPPRRQPPAFQLVADDRHVYVHVDDSVVEAWQLRDGSAAWRRDVGRTIVADGVLVQGELITFVGDDYPTPRAPSTVRPIAIEIGGMHRVRRYGGEVRAVLAPSFAVRHQWILTAPDDRVFAWPLVGGRGPLIWRCWRLPGGLLPQDAAGEMFPLDAATFLTYTRGTGTLTLFRVGAGGVPESQTSLNRSGDSPDHSG